MKCKNCGANHSSWALECPYCSTPNPRGRLWRNQQKKAQSDLDTAKKAVGKRLSSETAEKIINRVLAVELLICVLSLVGVFLFFFLGDAASNTEVFFKKGQIEKQMSEMYDNQQFNELYTLLHDTGLFGTDYYEYSQMALMYKEYDAFVLARMEFFSEAEKNQFSAYTMTSLIDSINDVFNPQIGIYSELTDRNALYSEKYQEEVTVFATYVLGVTDEELELLRSEYIPYDRREALAQTLIGRRYWDGN